MLRNRKIVVIGAGIGGLTVAIALAQRGATVTVLEQAAEISEVGAGLQVTPNGLAVLRALGLEDRLRAQAVAAEAVVLKDYRRQGPVLNLDLKGLRAPNSYFFIHRADLIGILAQAARDAGVQVQLLQAVDRVVPGAPPQVHLAKGAVLQPDFVIGADGVRSRTRLALGEGDHPFFTGQVAWRAVVPNVGNQPAEARVYMGPGRHIVCYPLRDGTMLNLVAVQERTLWAEEGWQHRDDPDNLRAAFADFGEEAQAMLSQVKEVGLWGLFRHPVAESWYAPGVAILGDAAHPTLPFLAQGANLAMEDAWVLSDTLASMGLSSQALVRYQSRRETRATDVIAAANGNAWRYHLRLPPLRWAAHLVLGMAGALAPSRVIGGFDWIYGHDVTVGD